jgi:hypothetical protein
MAAERKPAPQAAHGGRGGVNHDRSKNAARPSDKLSRAELVVAVSAGHTGAQNIAFRMTDISLRRMLDAGIVGEKLYNRVTNDGKGILP